MARMKQTPIKSSRSSKSYSKRERRKPAKRGTTDSGSDTNNKKRQRSRASTSTRALPIKRKLLCKDTINDHLPPELRQAGLLARQSITKGKCFGPFRGQFVKSIKKTLEDHVFVCKVTGVDKQVYYFYVHNADQDKCMWLQRLQSAASKKHHNIVAYKSAVGVCYEATCDINSGQELLVLYDDTYGGKKYPAYVENIPVHFVSPSGLLQVVPLDDTNSEILGPNDETINEQSMATTSEREENDDNDEDENDSNNDDVGDHDGDADYVASDDDEDDSVDNDDDDDDEDDSIDDDELDDDMVVDDLNDTDYTMETKKHVRKAVAKQPKEIKKPAVAKKKNLQIYERKTVDYNLDNITETITYMCSYCAMVHPNKEAADEHMTSSACRDQVFTCGKCQAVLESNLMKPLHKCHPSYKCTVCDMEFPSNKQLAKHTKNTADDIDHRPKCNECACSFRSVKDKLAHLDDKHPKEPINCPVCSRKYKNMSYLREHIRSHLINAFRCPECQKQFSSKSNLRKHVRKHNPSYKPSPDKRRASDGTKRHACEKCGKRFDNPRNVEVHMRTHTGERPFECNLCSWKFSQLSHLKRHLNTVHAKEGEKQVPKAELPKTCEICNKVYANIRVLRVHIQSIHHKERPHKCNHCDRTFSQRGHLWRHKHTVHIDSEEVQKKIRESGFVCKIDDCDKGFPCQSELINHQKTVHRSADWTFICEKCDGRFATKSNLARHIKRQHANEEGLTSPFICDECNKEFTSLYKLDQHKRMHTGEKEFKCDLCGQMFVQKSGLRKHIRCRRCPNIDADPNYALSNKKYECNKCLRVLPGPADLKAHLRTHSGERPFECEQCHKNFSQPGNLAKHIKYVHQKMKRPKEKKREKKFFCSLCGKAFSCPSSLAMHCRIHSGTKPFQCDKCDVAFAQLGNLKKHINRWHEGDGTVPPKRRRKKRREEEVAAAANSERLEQNEVTMETSDENEAEKLQAENEDTIAGHNSEDRGGESNEAATIEERATAEQASIAAILTSINSDPSLANPRGFTPLNTPTHGFFISPLHPVQTTVGPSVIMNNLGATVPAQIQIPQSTNSVEASTSSFTRPNQILVPPQLSAFVPPAVTVPHTTSPGCSDGTSTSTAILPHVNTILSPQLNPVHFIPHSTHLPEMNYPFSPSSLFQH